MRTATLGKCTALALVVLAVTASPVAAYEVSYNYYCYATGSDGIPVMDNDILTDEWYVDGDYIKWGGSGNYGTARFCADISAATISAAAHSHGVQTGPYSFPSGTGRAEKCRFRDDLTFVVPAGTYPDGVYVSIFGRALGSVTSDVGAGARARVYVSFGQNYDTGLLEVGIDESGTITLNEIFTLTQEFVAPGGTLNQATEYSRSIVASITGGRTWSTSYNPGGGSVIGDGDLDFTDGVRLLAMQVSPGVSWTSDSGVFPFLPTAVGDDPAIARVPQLRQNHPNPFNPATTIRFVLPSPTAVDLRVFDVSGRLMTTLLDGVIQDAGLNEIVWRGEDDQGRPLASGIYHYRLEADGFAKTKRMVLLR